MYVITLEEFAECKKPVRYVVYKYAMLDSAISRYVSMCLAHKSSEHRDYVNAEVTLAVDNKVLDSRYFANKRYI